MNRALWIVQTLLAALFIFGGCAKLAMPIDELSAAAGLPGLFLQFISLAEVLGGLGLILPGLLRIQVADPEKSEEAEFIMLKDGGIAFEGHAAELRASNDRYLQTFLS